MYLMHSWHRRTRVFIKVFKTFAILCLFLFCGINVLAVRQTPADLFFNKGKQCWDQGKADSAFVYYSKAADLYKKNNNQKQYTISKAVSMGDNFIELF